MKRRVAAAAAAVAVVLLGGRGKELSHAEAARVLGVDGAAEGVMLAVPQEEGCLMAEGEDLLDAEEKLKSAGDKRLELTHVTAVVLGETEELKEWLWQQVKHRKSGYGARLWLAEGGGAAELLAGQATAAERLENLEENGGVDAPTLMEGLRELTENGKTTLPVVGLRDGRLCLVGWKTVKAGEEEDGRAG